MCTYVRIPGNINQLFMHENEYKLRHDIGVLLMAETLPKHSYPRETFAVETYRITLRVTLVTRKSGDP